MAAKPINVSDAIKQYNKLQYDLMNPKLKPIIGDDLVKFIESLKYIANDLNQHGKIKELNFCIEGIINLSKQWENDDLRKGDFFFLLTLGEKIGFQMYDNFLKQYLVNYNPFAQIYKSTSS